MINTTLFLLIFLPVALCGCFMLQRRHHFSGAMLWLSFASLFFYAYWDARSVPILITSIVINYTLGNLTKDSASPKFKRFFLGLSLSFNLFLLSLFKYTDISIFPLGISFFTLQQIAYQVDTFEGVIKDRGFLNYFSFVSFFPKLISGPLMSFSDYIVQIHNPKATSFRFENLSTGLFVISLGLVKKFFLSDFFSGWAEAGFVHSQSLDFYGAWKTSLAYTFQLYFDFSGYTDMAIGLAVLFNIRIPQNFDSPFKSKSVIEFWNRWHITLSLFIKTYIFTTILRAFKDIRFPQMTFATFVSMLIMGIWHGAGWTFVIYGSLHGLALIVNHIWRMSKIRLPEWLSWIMTFIFVSLTFIFFRAGSTNEATGLIRTMFTLPGSLSVPLFDLVIFVLTFIFMLGMKNSGELEKTFESDAKESISGIYYISSGLGKTILFAEALSYLSEFFMTDAWGTSLTQVLRYYLLWEGCLDLLIGCGLLFKDSRIASRSWSLLHPLFIKIDRLLAWVFRRFAFVSIPVFVAAWVGCALILIPPASWPAFETMIPFNLFPLIGIAALSLSLKFTLGRLRGEGNSTVTTFGAFFLGVLFITSVIVFSVDHIRPVAKPQFIYFRF